MVGEGMLVRDALLRMQGGALQSATVAGNGSLLVRLQLPAGPMTVLGMAGQCCVTGCRVAWPCGQTML
jgi:hypothetical protein